MKFAVPWAFLLLALLPVLVMLHLGKLRSGSIRFPSTASAGAAGRSLRQRLLWLPLALRVLALALIVVALARPQFGREEIQERTKGIAIEMVVDRSGTMGLDMSFGRKNVTRLEAVKTVFQEFITGNGTKLKGRPNDMIGMVAFARYPDTLCPLTLSHAALLRFLEDIQVVKRPDEDGTAIGDAVALAAARLKTAEDSLYRNKKEKQPYEIKSKIMILLTDGQNNCGRRSPLEAAELSKQWGIKIYTIGVGSEEAFATVQTPFGPYKVLMGPGLDEDTLKSVAEKTRGIYRSANTAEALRTIYAEIDRLEKSEIQTTTFQEYSENFWPWALAALLVLAVEVILSCSYMRRIP